MHAVIVARSRRALDPEVFLGWCRERLASDKRPRPVSAVDVSLESADGKFRKHEIRAPYRKERQRCI